MGAQTLQKVADLQVDHHVRHGVQGLEVENPGGLASGLTVPDLGRRSVRRNRLLADLLFRARYVERVGSGIPRMRRALEENGNPPTAIVASNFFVLCSQRARRACCCSCRDACVRQRTRQHAFCA